MKKLQYYNGKSLKLTNVLKYEILLEENFDFNVSIEQMQSYIKTKGCMQVGPLIQYTNSVLNNHGELGMDVVLMLQCNKYIHSVESPYSMEAVIRVQNALYCRYTGPESKLSFAYNKIHVEAFEQDILVGNNSYTIFVNSNKEEDILIADVFIPRINEE